MDSFWEKHRKGIFISIVVLTFLTILVYNFLTPYYTDDFAYALEARQAKSLWDLVKQQYIEYMYHNCRVIGQFNLRVFLSVDKWVFNIVNSAMFTALVLLIYASVKRKKKQDIFVLLLSLAFVWRYSVRFGETTLWLCGSCNYLWGSVIMVGFLVWYRHLLDRENAYVHHPVPTAILGFVFGLAAGWCNENTSGGVFLAWLFFTLIYLMGWRIGNDEKVDLDSEKGNAEGEQNKKPSLGTRIRLRMQGYMITSGIGIACGLLAMVLCPGIRSRVGDSEETFTGIAKLLSRFYKITVSVQELFGEVLIILLIAVVILVLQKKLKNWKETVTNEAVIFLIVSIATCYALIVIPPPTPRAYYGAGVFLFIACIQAINDCDRKEFTVALLKYGLVSVLCLWLMFTYFNNMINLWRINRENNERIEIIQNSSVENGGNGTAVIPQFREEFKNPYSTAHDSDLSEDPDNWINLFYESYYGVDSVIAIPREEWDERYGDNEE